MSGGGEGSRHAGCGRVGLNSAATRGPLRRTGRAAGSGHPPPGRPLQAAASSLGHAGGRRRISELRAKQGRGPGGQRPVSLPLGLLSLVFTANTSWGGRPQPVTVAARPACPSGGCPCLSLGQLSGLGPGVSGPCAPATAWDTALPQVLKTGGERKTRNAAPK